YVGTNDASANTGGVSVIGVNTDTLHDLYDDTNNTTKKDDSTTQFDETDVVALSIHGSEPRYLAIAGTNDTTTKMWLESSDTSLKSHMANNIDPHGAFLNQTNLKVDDTLLLGESGQANLTALADDVKLTGNLQITGKTVFGGNLLPNSYATGSRATVRNLFTGSATWLGGQFNSIALGADDLPRIVHYDSFLGELYYMRCLKTDCSSYTVQLLDDGDPNIENDAVGDFTKIVIGPNNLPYISYHNVTRTGITYIRCLDQDCANRVKRNIDEESTVTNTALAVTSRGTPVFAYQQTTNNRVNVTTCSDMDCNQVTVRQIGEGSANVLGSFIEIALDSNDNPIMAYREDTALDLWVTACSTPDCSLYTTTQDVVATNSVGHDISIAIGTDNFPRIVYHDITATDKYVFLKCNNAQCSSPTSLTIDSGVSTTAGTTGPRTTIVMDSSDFSYVAYYDSTNGGGRLKFAQINNTPAIASGPTIVDDPTDNVGDAPWIDLASSGFPVIAHRNVTKTGVRLTNCGNATCTSGNTSQDIYSNFSLDTTTLDVTPVDMAIGNDNFSRLVIADATNGFLLYVRCLDLACSGIVVTTVDSTADVGDDPRIAIGQDGFARIAYRDTTNTNLKYARCTNDNCTSSNITSFTDLSSAAFAETSTGTGNSIVIGKDGLARIATLGAATFSTVFVRCLNDDCTSFHTNPMMDTGCNVLYRHTTMVLDPNDFGTAFMTCAVTGTPNTYYLQYTHCSDSDCAATDTAAAGTTVASNTASGAYGFYGMKAVWSPLMNTPTLTYSYSSDVTGFLTCTDYKTCTNFTSQTIGGTTASVYGHSIDPNTNLPVVFLRNGATEQPMVLRCSDPYCRVQSTNATYPSYPVYNGAHEGSATIRQVDGQSQYVMAIVTESTAGSAGLMYHVDTATIDIGNYDNPFGALFVSKLITRNTTVAGFDLAEDYQASEPLSAGDVVAFDLEASKTVRKTNTPGDPRLAGVVSTQPGLLLQDPQNKNGMYPIALAGRVPVKIASTSAAITIGDPLTSSSQAGKAQKQTRAGQSIGKALENWSCNSEVSTCKDTIEVFVNLGYADPDLVLTDAGNIQITLASQGEALQSASDSGMLASPSASLAYQVTNAAGDVVKRVGVFSEGVIGNLKAGQAQLDTLSPLASDSAGIAVKLDDRQTFGIYNKEGTPAAVFDTQGNATLAGTLRAAKIHLEGDSNFQHLPGEAALEVTGDASISGTLFADRIVTRFGDIGELKATTVSATYITNVTNIFTSANSSTEVSLGAEPDSTSSALLALGMQTDTNNPTLTISKPITLTSNFNVLGDTTLGRTTIAGSLLVDGSIRLTASAIDTISDTLYIQKSKFADVDIMNGALVVNTAGNVFINGDLTVTGTLATNVISPIGTSDLTIDLSGANSSTSGNLSHLEGESNFSHLPGENGFGKFIIRGPNNLIAASVDATGNATFSGALTTSKLVIADSAVSSATQSATATSNAIIGTATLPAGSLTIDITTTKVTKSSFIYITPNVKSKTDGTGLPAEASAKAGFTVAVDQPVTNDVLFNWWVVN
ncbi:hypothetical protein HYV22_00135, partial [Candidatus Gottesmanbacteria bacterium]|nr:hypothetical protein [Candidatus Gottesmanbacteria bacterium]